MTQWTNDDGLTVWYEREQSERDVPSAASVVTFGAKNQMVIDLNYDNLPAETTDSNNDGTNDGWNDGDPYIPAGSYITGAFIVVEAQWTTGSSAALNIGLSQKDGTVIDADGIDAAIATGLLNVDRAVTCDGALAGGTATIGGADAYVKAAASTGSFTGGKAKLVIEYISVQP